VTTGRWSDPDPAYPDRHDLGVERQVRGSVPNWLTMNQDWRDHTRRRWWEPLILVAVTLAVLGVLMWVAGCASVDDDDGPAAPSSAPVGWDEPNTSEGAGSRSTSELTQDFVEGMIPRLVQVAEGWDSPDDGSTPPAPGVWVLLGESPTGCVASARVDVEAVADPEGDPETAAVAAVREVAADLRVTVDSTGSQFVWLPSPAFETAPTQGYNLAMVGGQGPEGPERLAARREVNWLQLEGAPFTITTTTVRMACGETFDVTAWDELFAALRMKGPWNEEPGQWTVVDR